MKRRTYGYDRYRLYQHYTADDLTAMAMALRDDPANAAPEPRGIHIYNAITEKRLANIAYAIYYHQQDKRRGAA